MKKFLLLISLLARTDCFGQAKTVSDSLKFNTALSKHLSSFIFDGQKPNGYGWELLMNQFKENQFVAWGEYHNSALISRLTSYALESASLQGYKSWCVEVSPFVASELTRF